MYSNPSFDLDEAQNLDDYLKLEGNKRDNPLLNRATREFYVPGSTFKTFTLIAAFRAGKQDAVFASYPEGFKPTRNSRPIVDATQKLLPDGSVVGACDGGCRGKGHNYCVQSFKQSILSHSLRSNSAASSSGNRGASLASHRLIRRTKHCSNVSSQTY